MAIYFVSGTHVRAPLNLRSYQDKFKVIGKNLFVKPDSDAGDRVRLVKKDLTSMLASASTIEELRAHFGLTATKLRPATPAEVKEYEAAKSKYEKFCANARAKAYERRRKFLTASITKLEGEIVRVKARLAKLEADWAEGKLST